MSFACPYCVSRPLARLGVHGTRASRGDVAVCGECVGWSVYAAGPRGALYLRPPSPAERARAEGDSALLGLLVAVQLHVDVQTAIAWWLSPLVPS